MGVGLGTCEICKTRDYVYRDRIAGTLCVRCLTRAERILKTCVKVASVFKGAKLAKTGRRPDQYLKRIRENRADLARIRKMAYEAQVDYLTGLPGKICRECGTAVCIHNKPLPVPDNDQAEIPF